MRIHATAISNLTDARYFAAKEVDALGFFLEDGSDAFIDPSVMKAIKEWIQGPALAGWFERSSQEHIAEAVRFFGLDAAVIHQQIFSDTDTSALKDTSWSLWVPFMATHQVQVEHFSHPPDSLILDARGLKWTDVKDGMLEGSALADICRRRPTYLFCDDLDASTLESFQALAPLTGFCLSGGAEEKVGVKSFDDLEDLFDAMEGQS